MKFWPFNKKKEEDKPQEIMLGEVVISDTEEKMNAWVDGQINEGVPRGLIYKKLEHVPLDQINGYQRYAVTAAMQYVLGMMVERNLHGQELEKSGHIEQAIDTYLLNVNDWFEGGFPYERLRILFSRKKQYDHAADTCFAAMRNEFMEERKRKKFEEWYHKLCAKADASSP